MNKNSVDLPQFGRSLMRPEQSEAEKLGQEICFPNWKCFCCHDTGIVNPHLVERVISDYDYEKDKFPVCQNAGCQPGEKYINNLKISSSLDFRFDRELCQKLDLIHRQEWQLEKKRTISQLENKVIDLAKAKSLRRGERTQLENETAAQNHQIEKAK